MSYVKTLYSKSLIKPPKFVVDGMQYEVMTGSIAYGVATDTSDIDIMGITIPPKNIVFPHLGGTIQGFGRQIQKFEQFQSHHIKDIDSKKEYDMAIYNIVKFFQLCMDNNPNILDSLFVPQRCVLFCTQIGNIIRENRRLFLHRGSWFKFKGYAFSQISKMRNKTINEFVTFCRQKEIPTSITIEVVEGEKKLRKMKKKLDK